MDCAITKPNFSQDYNEQEKFIVFNSYHSISNECKKITLYCMGEYVSQFVLAQKLIALFSECNRLNANFPCDFHQHVYSTSKTFCYQSASIYKSSTNRQHLINNLISLNDIITKTLIDNDDRYQDEAHIVFRHSLDSIKD